MKELILHKYNSSATLHSNLKQFYPFISLKFECKEHTIEKDIRFAIKKAYETNKQIGGKQQILQKIPTVKQITNYLLDKFLSSAT